MNNEHLISSLYESFKKRAEVRALMPMGYVADLPLLTVKNDCLVAVVPFLRYKTTGVKDHTLVFPVRYVLEYRLPELSITGFRDLALDPVLGSTDFHRAAGFFRHEAVQHLNREQYTELRNQTLALYDKLCHSLLDENGTFDEADDSQLSQNLHLLLEPAVWRAYQVIDEDFYQRYMG